MSDLPTTFTNSTPARDVHPNAHNETNEAVNVLRDDLEALETTVAGIEVGSVDIDTLTDGTINHVFTAADDTKLAGIATGATANSSDATLLARANHTGTQSLDTTSDSATRLAMTSAERTKLTGVATGATANSADATLLARANHTGSQSLDTTTDSATRLAMTSAERTKLTGVQTAATANDTDANLKSRANHTGTQLAATISDFDAAVETAIPVAPTTEVDVAERTTNTSAITIDTLNLDPIPDLDIDVPDLDVPVIITAKTTVKHSVANASIMGCIAISGSTIITHALDISFVLLQAANTSKATIWAEARLPAHSPGTYRLFLAGTAGDVTSESATYYKSRQRAWSA